MCTYKLSYWSVCIAFCFGFVFRLFISFFALKFPMFSTLQQFIVINNNFHFLWLNSVVGRECYISQYIPLSLALATALFQFIKKNNEFLTLQSDFFKTIKNSCDEIHGSFGFVCIHIHCLWLYV